MTFLDIPQNSFYAMLAVLGLLVIASCTRLFLSAKNPNKDYTELRQRIQSWWWIIALLFLVLAGQPYNCHRLFWFFKFFSVKRVFVYRSDPANR